MPHFAWLYCQETLTGLTQKQLDDSASLRC